MAKPVSRKKKAPDFSAQISAALRQTSQRLASTWRAWLPQVLLIIAATLWIYWPCLNGAFVWDDGWYITTNPILIDPHGLWKFWFSPGCWVEYYPIQETVLWLQWKLLGEVPLGYHLTNVFLHVISALLVWKLFARVGLKWAWLGGLIFAVHPVQVESVAWISEMKNTLSQPFFLLTMIAWIDYNERHKREDYQWACFWFLIGLLCKITFAAFPIVILLYAWWKRGRVSFADFKASAPFFAITIILGVTSVWAGQIYDAAAHNQLLSTSLGTFPQMFARSGMIFGFYFANSLIPVDLTPIYPKWETDAGSFVAYLPWVGIVVALAWSWKERKRWGRHVILSLGFFGLTLAPFLGFHWVSYMVECWIELHLLYLPLIALIGLFIAGLADFCSKAPRSLASTACVAVGAGLVIFVFQARDYAGWFVSENTLWSRTLEGNPAAWIAYYDLGADAITAKKYEEALARYRQANLFRPDFAGSYYNMGVAYDKMGDEKQAEANYRKAIQLNPGSSGSYLNLGDMRRVKGDLGAAEKEYRDGLAVVPTDLRLTINLGDVLVRTGRVSEAIELYQKAQEKQSFSPHLEYNLGIVLMKNGSTREAEEHLKKAIELSPEFARAHGSLGLIYAQTGRLPEAIEEFKTTLELDPKVENVRDNLAMALAQSGRLSEATEQAQLELQADPDDAHAKDLLAKLKQAATPH